MQLPIALAMTLLAVTVVGLAAPPPKGPRAVATNGVLTARFEDGAFDLFLGGETSPTGLVPDRCVFRNVGFREGLWGPVPFHDHRNSNGWTQLFPAETRVMAALAESGKDGSAMIRVRRRFLRPVSARDIHVTETLRLLPSVPVIDYRIRFDNPTARTFFLGGRNVYFSAEVSGPLRGDFQALRSNGRRVGEGRVRWIKPRWVSYRARSGYGAGMSDMDPTMDDALYDDFHRVHFMAGQDGQRRFFYPLAGVKNGRNGLDEWIILRKGEETAGVRLYIFQPGQNPSTEMGGLWRQYAAGVPLKCSRSPAARRPEAVVPDAVHLLSPLPGVEITDISAHFNWRQIPGVIDYELQIAPTRGFTEPLVISVKMNYPRPYHFLTEKVLSAKRWFWRVRALAFDDARTPGPWSEVRDFTVDKDHTVSNRPIREVSPRKPLLLMEAGWLDGPEYVKHLSEQVRECIGFRQPLRGSEERKKLYAFQARNAAAHVPVVFSQEVPYGPAGRPGSLVEIEYMFQRYPNVLGLCVGEKFFYFFNYDKPDAPPQERYAREWIRRALILCAKYGRYFIWADSHKYGWWELARDAEIVDRRRAEYFIPTLKTTMGAHMWPSQSIIQGFQLTDTVRHTGVDVDVFYWSSAGQRRVGENSYARRQGDQRLMPPTLYAMMYIQSMMQGGDVMQSECTRIHGNDPGRPNALWFRYLGPFFSALLKHNMIPRRAVLLRQVHGAVAGELPVEMTRNDRIGFGKDHYGPFKELWSATYGSCSVIKDYFPKTSRYGYIPIIPPGFGRYVPEGVEVLPASKRNDALAVKAFFNRLYPPVDRGEALVQYVDGTIAVLNCLENTDRTQSFRLDLGKASKVTSRIAGRIGVHSYLMGKVEGDGTRLFLQSNSAVVEKNTRLLPNGSYDVDTLGTRNLELTLDCPARPRITVTPETAVVKQQWENGKLGLVLSHRNGAVEVYLTCPQ